MEKLFIVQPSCPWCDYTFQSKVDDVLTVAERFAESKNMDAALDAVGLKDRTCCRTLYKRQTSLLTSIWNNRVQGQDDDPMDIEE